MQILNEANKFSNVGIANAIMAKFTPNRKFIDSVQKFGASIGKLKNSFKVNGWYNTKTHGKIKKILHELSSGGTLINLNKGFNLEKSHPKKCSKNFKKIT